MFRKLLGVASILALGPLANGAITNVEMVRIFEGNLPESGTFVSSWDLMVTIEGDDAWVVAGNPTVGDPWASVTGGTFYQHPVNDFNPPDPDSFGDFPDSEFTSFYTTHLGWPNTPDQGVSPGFAFGPGDTDTWLRADWFLAPDVPFVAYPGTFTIARATIIPGEPHNWFAEVTVQVGSLETRPELYSFVIPEPGSLVLVALGSLALLRRR